MEKVINGCASLVVLAVVVIVVVLVGVLALNWSPANTDRVIDRSFDLANRALVALVIVAVCSIAGFLLLAEARRRHDRKAEQQINPAVLEMYRQALGWQSNVVDGHAVPIAGMDHWRERKARADALAAEQKLLTGQQQAQANLPPASTDGMDLGTWRGGQDPQNWP